MTTTTTKPKYDNRANATLDRATLRRLYEDEQLTDKQIGERYGVTGKAIHQRRQRAGIDSRPRGMYDRGTQPAAHELPHTPDPLPVPPPGKRRKGVRKPKRPFLRLSEVERKIVQRSVDQFLVWCEARKELA